MFGTDATADTFTPNSEGAGAQQNEDPNAGSGAAEGGSQQQQGSAEGGNATEQFDADGNPIAPAAADPWADYSEEIEHDGRKYKLPAVLREGVMFQQAYTQKTMALAERRTALDSAERDFVDRMDHASRNMQAHAQLAGLDQMIANYEKVNWTAEAANNQQAANAEWFKYQQAKDLRAQLAGQLQASEEQWTSKQQAALEARVREGAAVLATQIPGWGPAVQTDIARSATQDYGFTPKELGTVSDLRMIRVLHDAMQFRKLQAKAQAKPAQARGARQQAQGQQQSGNPAAAAVKPAGQLPTGAGSPAVDPSKMSSEQWRAWRNQQVSALSRKFGR